jgi:CheY-like chemotaxis protein
MRILLIEDDAFKAKRVRGLLQRASSDYHVNVERSVTAGLAGLFDEPPPDVLLLDMSLSTFDVGPRETGGRPQNFGGVTVLEHMARRGSSVPVVIVTQFETFPTESGEMSLEDLARDLASRFPAIFRGLIYYSSRETEWEERLVSSVATLAAAGGHP